MSSRIVHLANSHTVILYQDILKANNFKIILLEIFNINNHRYLIKQNNNKVEHIQVYDNLLVNVGQCMFVHI